MHLLLCRGTGSEGVNELSAAGQEDKNKKMELVHPRARTTACANCRFSLVDVGLGPAVTLQVVVLVFVQAPLALSGMTSPPSSFPTLTSAAGPSEFSAAAAAAPRPPRRHSLSKSPVTRLCSSSDSLSSLSPDPMCCFSPRPPSTDSSPASPPPFYSNNNNSSSSNSINRA